MTETEHDIEITEVDSIEREQAMKPWGLNEMTTQSIRHIEGLHSRIDAVYVPRFTNEPVDYVEALFTIDERVLGRRDRELADVAEMVIEEIEDDPRLEEYVFWEGIEPGVIAARIDEERTRVKITWQARGGE